MLGWTDLEDVRDRFVGELRLLVEHGEIRWQANRVFTLATETLQLGLIHEEDERVFRHLGIDIRLLCSRLLDVGDNSLLVRQEVLDLRLHLRTVLHHVRVPTEGERRNVARGLRFLDIADLPEGLDNALIRLVVDGFELLPLLRVNPV